MTELREEFFEKAVALAAGRLPGTVHLPGRPSRGSEAGRCRRSQAAREPPPSARSPRSRGREVARAFGEDDVGQQAVPPLPGEQRPQLLLRARLVPGRVPHGDAGGVPAPLMRIELHEGECRVRASSPPEPPCSSRSSRRRPRPRRRRRFERDAFHGPSCGRPEGGDSSARPGYLLLTCRMAITLGCEPTPFLAYVAQPGLGTCQTDRGRRWRSIPSYPIPLDFQLKTLLLEEILVRPVRTGEERLPTEHVLCDRYRDQ